jgi:hypothetical protein
MARAHALFHASVTLVSSRGSSVSSMRAPPRCCALSSYFAGLDWLRLRCLWRILAAQTVVVGLVALSLLGHARPPDPTWIDGIYDHADYDDVVQLVRETPIRAPNANAYAGRDGSADGEAITNPSRASKTRAKTRRSSAAHIELSLSEPHDRTTAPPAVPSPRFAPPP